MSNNSEDSSTDISLELADTSGISENVRKVVTAGILASLSIAVAPTAAFIPRIPGWGIAFFDPVSLFWISAFLIGGIWVGLVCTGIGTIGLFFFDPTGIGPLFKLLATVPMIAVPWLGVMMRRRDIGGSGLSDPIFYTLLMIIAFLLRLVIMVPLNMIIAPILWGIEDVFFIMSFALIINTSQSFWDAAVPYIIIHVTPIFDHFGMW